MPPPVAPKKEVLARYESTLAGYAEGSIVKGTIVRITDYGVFVELDQGVEGLIQSPRKGGSNGNGTVDPRDQIMHLRAANPSGFSCHRNPKRFGCMGISRQYPHFRTSL